jgi:hypothetical protein
MNFPRMDRLKSETLDSLHGRPNNPVSKGILTPSSSTGGFGSLRMGTTGL